MLDKKEIKAVNKVLRSKKLSGFVAKQSNNFNGGKYVNIFEKKLEKYFKVKYAITLNSWTSGLICCVGATGIKPGDEVIVPSWTMSATVVSILHWNAIPIFADIDPDTFNLDPDKIQNKITSRTKLIIFADIFGNPANYKKIIKIAKKYKLKVIADSAQAPGIKYDNNYCGTISELGGLSLNYHKHIHTGEGGVIFTNDKILSDKVKMLRNHGENITEGKSSEFLNNMIGFNFRMGEMEAAVGIEQLKKLKMILKKKQDLSYLLTKQLQDLKGLKLPLVKDYSKNAFYIYPLVLNKDIIKTSRKKIALLLEKEIKKKIIIAGYQNIHRLPIFKKKKCYGGLNFPWKLNANIKYDYSSGSLPVSEELHNKTFIGILMCKYDLEFSDVYKISKSFKKVWKKIN